MFYFHDLTVGKFEKKKTKLYLLIKEFSASLCFSKKAETFISSGNSLGVETRNSNMFASIRSRDYLFRKYHMWKEKKR